MVPWFIATEAFNRENGEAWEKFIEWSGLTQLDEVVSLDGMLCPTLLPEIHDDYWDQRVTWQASTPRETEPARDDWKVPGRGPYAGGRWYFRRELWPHDMRRFLPRFMVLLNPA